MTKEQELKVRGSFTSQKRLNEMNGNGCLIRLTQEEYQGIVQLILHLDNKIRVLTDDNKQLMYQINAKGYME
jgi:hypothetical protein